MHGDGPDHFSGRVDFTVFHNLEDIDLELVQQRTTKQIVDVSMPHVVERGEMVLERLQRVDDQIVDVMAAVRRRFSKCFRSVSRRGHRRSR